MVEWDTFLFFYGIMLCVGGLGAIGYLNGLSTVLYTGLGNTTANILIGLLSAIIDNIPLTYAVLTMMPQMDHGPMAPRHSRRWHRRLALIHRIRSRRCSHGAQERHLHVLFAFEMELGNSPRLRRGHRDAHLDEWGDVQVNAGTVITDSVDRKKGDRFSFHAHEK